MIAEFVFLVIAAVSLYASYKVIRTEDLVHSAIWLAVVLASAAGLYLTLNAEFIALIQILVYVGAVVTLMLFTVMLTIPREETELDFLKDLELPPGITIESVQDLQLASPRGGQGPMKHLTETNPRKPKREISDLTGVLIDDDVYGTERTQKKQNKEGST